MRGKIKNILLVIVIVCIAVAFLSMLFGILGMFGVVGDGKDDLSFAVAIFSIVSGLAALGSLLVAMFTIVNDSVANVRLYYEAVEKEDIVNARHLLYLYRDFRIDMGISVCDKNPDFDEIAKEYSSDEDSIQLSEKNIRAAASKMANFYQMWGLLHKNGLLPIWVFETSSGNNIIRIYDTIKDIIDEKKKKNALYADEYINFCNIIKKKYKVKIKSIEDIRAEVKAKSEAKIPVEEM